MKEWKKVIKLYNEIGKENLRAETLDFVKLVVKYCIEDNIRFLSPALKNLFFEMRFLEFEAVFIERCLENIIENKNGKGMG